MILTGMGSDGTDGARDDRRGRRQRASRRTKPPAWSGACRARSRMPGVCSAVLPLDQIAPKIVAAVPGGPAVTPARLRLSAQAAEGRAPASCCRPTSNIWSKAGCCRSRASAGLSNLTGLVAKLQAADAEALDRRGGRGDDHQRVVLLPRQDSVRAFPRHHHAGAAGRARARAAHPHLVRRRLDRPGALFARHVPEGDGQGSSPAGASRSSPPISRPRCWKRPRAGIYSQFEVQRGLPIQMLIKYFAQVGETWQIAPEIRAMVQFRPLNLLNDFSPARHVRRGVLPQRADLFRSGDQDRRARPHRRRHRARRLPGARRRRDRGRADRELQAGARQARRLLRQTRRHGSQTF